MVSRPRSRPRRRRRPRRAPDAGLVRSSSAARALNIVGDRWTLLVLYAAFMGTRRFDDFIRMTGMARSLLVDRLKRLESHGLMDRRPYQHRPVRRVSIS